MALPVSRLVRVIVNLAPVAAARRSFGVLMVAGDSDVINPAERYRTYDSISGVAEDFGVEAPEYKAAEAYFGQTPKPRSIMIGRWVRTASPALNIGGILSAAQQLISNWTAISSGGFQIVVDGVTKSLTGLDFTAVTNLNGVATVINNALSGADIFWDGSKFYVESDTTGAGVKASGTVQMTSNQANNDTLTLNSVVITFKSSVTDPLTQVLIGGSIAATMANLQAFLNATVNAGLTVANYSTVDDELTIQYKTIGTGGNAYSLAQSAAKFTLSGATLTGGAVASSVSAATAPVSGTDISALLRLTSGTLIELVDGYDAESPVEAAAILANESNGWYGLMFQASVQPTDDQSIDVSSFIEALDVRRVYGVTITDANVTSSLVDDDLASRQKDAGFLRSFCQYSQNAYAIASLFGRAFSVNFNAQNSTITLMYKQEPGIAFESLSTTQANTLKAKRCNVFVEYDNDTAIIQYGTMSGPAWIDEIHGLDWFQNAIQNACYNLLYTSPTKIPQTDAGSNQLVNVINGVCNEAVNNGLVAPGVWTSAVEFGQLVTGMFLKSGYYVYVQPMAQQSQADREARICPPIQVAIKLAGAIQELDVVIEVNR